MFYDIFSKLCSQKGVSPNKACIEMNLSRSLAAKWKNTGANPSADALYKMSAYFGVSVDYLLGKENNTREKTTPGNESGLDELDRRLLELLKLMSPDQKKLLAAQIEFLNNNQ